MLNERLYITNLSYPFKNITAVLETTEISIKASDVPFRAVCWKREYRILQTTANN